ncbi:SDR family oxidoreductase [Rapidithrix thailandica]|uniref:SDR family oxidoreductase n=1 Tax=Rapidithrix thailandica TaxID=413964 RepID=A0AAW9SBD2_9BACT
MKGKICVVTGATSGIGYETALEVARQGAKVFILCRNEQKGTEAVAKIAAETGNQDLEVLLVDLSSQKSIRKVADQLHNKVDKIDVLVNNAGTWVSNLTLTEDQVEMQFAVNHLAYFLMTHLLLPLLAKAEQGRVVCVSSDSHFHSKMHFDDLNLTKKYHGLRAYAQSKLANVMFGYELDRQLKARNLNISINCVQPGLVKTDIGLKHTVSFHGLMWKLRRLGGVSPAKGAETSIFLASSDAASGQSGKYWDKCKPKPSSKASYVEADQKRLWEISQKLCKVEDYFANVG